MNKETLEQAYNWFVENDFEPSMDVDNLTLTLSVWNTPLSECDDILLSDAEVEYRAELYKSNK